MTQIFKFNRQLRRGESWENMLDAMFSDEYTIEHASDAEQRRGLDRWYARLCSSKGRRYGVQYKADEKACETGNCFIETVSVDSAEKPGWVYTCEADFIFYFFPQLRLVYVLSPRQLRGAVELWKDIYPTKPAQNEGYQTLGVCVPVAEVEGCALSVYHFRRERAV